MRKDLSSYCSICSAALNLAFMVFVLTEENEED